MFISGRMLLFFGRMIYRKIVSMVTYSAILSCERKRMGPPILWATDEPQRCRAHLLHHAAHCHRCTLNNQQMILPSVNTKQHWPACDVIIYGYYLQHRCYKTKKKICHVNKGQSCSHSNEVFLVPQSEPFMFNKWSLEFRLGDRSWRKRPVIVVCCVKAHLKSLVMFFKGCKRPFHFTSAFKPSCTFYNSWLWRHHFPPFLWFILLDDQALIFCLDAMLSNQSPSMKKCITYCVIGKTTQDYGTLLGKETNTVTNWKLWFSPCLLLMPLSWLTKDRQSRTGLFCFRLYLFRKKKVKEEDFFKLNRWHKSAVTARSTVRTAWQPTQPAQNKKTWTYCMSFYIRITFISSTVSAHKMSYQPRQTFASFWQLNPSSFNPFGPIPTLLSSPSALN